MKTRYLNVVVYLEKCLILAEGVLHPSLASMDKDELARNLAVQEPSSWPACKGCFHHLLLMGLNCQNYYSETPVNLKIHLMIRPNYLKA